MFKNEFEHVSQDDVFSERGSLHIESQNNIDNLVKSADMISTSWLNHLVFLGEVDIVKYGYVSIST